METKDLISVLVEGIKTQGSDSRIIAEITAKLAKKKYRQVFLIFNNL